MQISKLILIGSTFCIIGSIYSKVPITDFINNSYQEARLVYPFYVPVQITSSRSIVTGSRGSDAVQASAKSTTIILPPYSITSLEGAYIPESGTSSAQKGLHIGFGTQVEPIDGKGIGVFALIVQSGVSIQQIPVINGAEQFIKRKDIPKGDMSGTGFILEIDKPDKITISSWTKEKIDKYSNPGKLPVQELLHQAITNDSVKDIKVALSLGADINMGIGGQPPLLLAILAKKDSSIKALLDNGADPNINYLSQPILTYVLKFNNYELALLLLKKENLKLSDNEKQAIIELLMLNSSHPLNQTTIEVLKLIGYEVKDNFKSSDLTQNKWYKLLVKHPTGFKNGKPFGSMGLPSLDMVLLFLKNGADPNQIFQDAEGLVWSPLLLIVDNYIDYANKRCDSDAMKKLIKTLVDAGADVNFKTVCLPDKKEASPLSYLLKYDESNCVIDILVDNKANIATAVQLFLNAGGPANKTFRFWQKSGAWDVLSWAVDNNNPEAVRILIKAGASNPNVLQLAISRGYGEIINILMQQKTEAEEAGIAEKKKQAEETRKLEEVRKLEEERKVAEEKRQAEETKKVEETRKQEEQRKLEEARIELEKKQIEEKQRLQEEQMKAQQQTATLEQKKSVVAVKGRLGKAPDEKFTIEVAINPDDSVASAKSLIEGEANKQKGRTNVFYVAYYMGESLENYVRNNPNDSVKNMQAKLLQPRGPQMPGREPQAGFTVEPFGR